MESIEFRDLKRQYNNMKAMIDEQISNVIASAHFISGPQVKALEQELADYTGSRHCISCANGTDAISIALLASGIGELGGGSRSDAVFVPDFTFFSSGECPAMVGATPIFVDVRSDTYNIDADSLEQTIKTVINEGNLVPKAVIAVDLFGQPFEMERIQSICDRYDLLLLEDAAQGFGGACTLYASNGSKTVKKAGTLGDISTTSFFPAKPLGCYGDGGAIFTDDDEIAALCRSIAVHGKNADDKYDNIRLGMNSRLDTLQAGILLAKLEGFKEYELSNVNDVAALYSEQLRDVEGLALPVVLEGLYSSWAQYAVQLPTGTDRAAVQAYMKMQGIPTMIYYVKPMHKQGAFAGTRSAIANCPNTEKICDSVLCLPIHPYLEKDEVKMVADRLKEALRKCK